MHKSVLRVPDFPSHDALCLSPVSQRLAESAEDADLYHDFNASLQVGALVQSR